MKVNPKNLLWQAPTTNVDGTPIDYALEYEVGLVSDAGVLEPLMTVPAQLQTGNSYEAPIGGLALDWGTYEIALRTFAKDDPARKSDWSQTVEFALSERIPNPPLELRVA